MEFNKSHLEWILAFAVCLSFAPSARAIGQSESERYALLGQKALAEGQYSEARSNFEQLAKLQPGVAEVHATLAAICFKLREYDGAATEVRKAQRLNPNLPGLNSLLGLSLAELGQFSDALPRLEKGFKEAPEPEVRRMCGLQLLRAYSGLGRDADAVTTSLELNKLYPNDLEVLYHTGRIYGNYAYIVMEKLHDKGPNSIWMLQAQGEANESQKDYDSAIIAFNHVLVLDPTRPGIHYRLGRIYLARFQQSRRPDDHDSAKREFLAELNVVPGNGNASYELAQISADDNDLDQAQSQFEAVLERFPDFEQALVGLAGVYLQNKMAARAVAPLERATKLDPSDEVAWYRLAQAERSAGNQDAAQKALETFRTLHDSSNAANKPPLTDEVTQQQLGPGAQP
jgi:tetratricopeptide (TPR) repeat protein